jgi:hypothetical protein
MYGAAEAQGDRMDRPADSKNHGFNGAFGSEIDLGRLSLLADRQQFLLLRLGSPVWSSRL